MTKWRYHENQSTDLWQGDLYNWFFVDVFVDSEIKYAKEAFFYFERVKEGISMIFDNTQMTRECGGMFKFYSVHVSTVKCLCLIHFVYFCLILSETALIPNGYTAVRMLKLIDNPVDTGKQIYSFLSIYLHFIIIFCYRTDFLHMMGGFQVMATDG